MFCAASWFLNSMIWTDPMEAPPLLSHISNVLTGVYIAVHLDFPKINRLNNESLITFNILILIIIKNKHFAFLCQMHRNLLSSEHVDHVKTLRCLFCYICCISFSLQWDYALLSIGRSAFGSDSVFSTNLNLNIVFFTVRSLHKSKQGKRNDFPLNES